MACKKRDCDCLADIICRRAARTFVAGFGPLAGGGAGRNILVGCCGLDAAVARSRAATNSGRNVLVGCRDRC